MGMNILQRFLSRWKAMSFSAWQVELTTRCPLKCRMCIRESSTGWKSADMSIDQFKKLAPYFRNVENVILQGWGEPLLYKDLVEAVRIVHEAGSHPGFVTSAWGLNESTISDLMEAGVDFIGFSLAGATREIHESIRVNSNFSHVLQSIENCSRLKADLKLEKPRLHIVFLMLKDNLAELPLLPGLARRIGIERIILTNLVQVTNAWQNSQKAFSCDERAETAYLEEAKAKAKELGIALKSACLSPQTMDVCEEDPTRNLYISTDGQVSPCVYLYPPLPSPISRFFCNDKLCLEKVTFGNIFEEPLDRIWNRADYAAFRECFHRRRRFAETHSFAASLVPDMERLGGVGAVDLPESPEPCRTCHRMFGV